MSERITWHVDVPPNTTVHVESSSQAVETRIEPVSKHDGKLDEKGNAEVWFTKGLHITPYVHIGDRDETVVIDSKQALSLLVWLEQEKGKLEQLAKEQAE